MKVTTAAGAAFLGAAVTFAATGGGTVSAPSVTTDAQGQASVMWTLRKTAGTTNDTATATLSGVSGSPVVFIASVTSAAAAQIALNGGNSQTAPAGTTLPTPYTVKVSDAFGNPVANTTVGWAVSSGGGSVSSASSQTNASGIATVQRALGPEPGAQTAAASAAGLAGSPVSFSATATPNGTISGNITLANGFLAPPRTTVAAGGGMTLTASARTKAVSSQSLSVHVAPRASFAPLEPTYTPDELIVTFRPEPLSAPPVGSRAMASVATASALGVAIRARLSTAVTSAGLDVSGVSPAILAARVRVPDPARLDAVAALLRSDPAVAAVERNPIAYADDEGATTSSAVVTTLPNEPLYPWQAWHYGIIDLPAAWDMTKGSASVLVAVVDNGIRFDHPAVAGNLTSDGYDFVSSLAVPLCGGGTIDNAGDGNGYDSDPTEPADYSFDGNMNPA